MLRKYTRKVGSRIYNNTPPEVMQLALSQVRGGASIYETAKSHNIPYGTLWNKVKNKHQNKPGHPIALTKIEEENLLHVIDVLTQWRHPLNGTDIKLLVKSYLDKKGVQLKAFKDNCPGDDWISSFIKRHNLTQRVAENVKPARAEVDREIISDFFDNYELEAEHVPSENVCNYDETNVTNEPGAKKIICRKGRKRVERKIDHSKASVSLMYSGFADGELLPPMVVYKSKHVYTNWTNGGPDGTIYDCTSSGWFDLRTFENWFFKIYLPRAKEKAGPKILVGDNLSSHFSCDVIEACEEYNIRFVALPPNSTHLTQPLDVCFFRPTKRHWRKVLADWRKETRHKGAIPKSTFPKLLSKLHNKLVENGMSQNLKSGFEACGLSPANRQQVLKKLPVRDEAAENSSFLNDAVMDILQQSNSKNKSREKRGKKVSVTSGKRICLADISTASNNEATPSTSSSTRAEPPAEDAEIPDGDDNVDNSSLSSGEENSEFSHELDEENVQPLQGIQEVFIASDISVGDYILVNVPTTSRKKQIMKKYIALVQESKEDGFVIVYLKMLKQPDLFILNQHDTDFVIMEDIIGKLGEPTLSKRSGLKFNVNCLEWDE